LIRSAIELTHRSVHNRSTLCKFIQVSLKRTKASVTEQGAEGRVAVLMLKLVFTLLICAADAGDAAHAAAVAKDAASAHASPDSRFRLGQILYGDDFRGGLANWALESEQSARVAASGGVLDIDTPAGLTLWLRAELRGPILIEYQAAAISAGGPNDRVSDLNCFWMAADPHSPGTHGAGSRDHASSTGPPSGARRGAFADYNNLLSYYVGLGGNGNTTTRFRRYIGSETERPLLPENDRTSPAGLLRPNVFQTIRLVADDGLIQYYRDEQRLFEYEDPHPYTHGWFAIRTTKSHLRIRHFRVYRLIPRD
jgi:hypothetical protein